jgi:hypothetical protein
MRSYPAAAAGWPAGRPAGRRGAMRIRKSVNGNEFEPSSVPGTRIEKRNAYGTAGHDYRGKEILLSLLTTAFFSQDLRFRNREFAQFIIFHIPRHTCA